MPTFDKFRSELPDMNFELPETAGLENIKVFQKLAEELNGFVQSCGTMSDWILRRKREIEQKVVMGGYELPRLMEEPRDIRAVIALWRESEQFRRSAPVNSKILDRIKILSPKLSPIVLRPLICLFLEQFDHLGDGYEFLYDFIRRGLAELPSSRAQSSDMKIYKKLCHTIFDYDGPERLVATANREKRSLAVIAKEWGIPDGTPGRFYQVSKLHYYIKKLKQIPLGQHNDIFRELLREEVYTSPFKKGLLLGHEMTMVLIDRALETNVSVSEIWSKQILAVMGDPRIPRQSARFHKWWGRLPEKYAAAMRGWLSQWDLKLFLKILEETGIAKNNQHMLRMFKKRKRFLEGLYNQGLIQHARLLLGREAVHFLHRNSQEENLPEFGTINSKDQSLIYLNVRGVHILEGTHNFAVRIYKDLPIPGLANYEKKNFNLGDITRNYQPDHRIINTNSKKPAWQHKFITTLAKSFNIRIDPEHVLSDRDYRIYRREFGMTLF